MRPIQKDSTDQSVVIRIIDSTTFLPETAVEHDTAGIALWYRREGATTTAITEAALAALDSAHSDGGIEHIGDGYYRLDLPDAAVATGVNGVTVGGTVTGMVVIGCYVPLVSYNPYDAVRMGLTSLPNAAADAAGGLPISDAGGLDIDAKLANTHEVTAARMGALTDWIDAGRLDALLDAIKAKTDSLTFTVPGDVDVNVQTWLGTAVATPGTAGVPSVDTIRWQNGLIPTQSVAGVPEVDITHVGGVAASGSSTIDANVVSISGDTTAADNCELMFDGTGYAGGTTKLGVTLANAAHGGAAASLTLGGGASLDNAAGPGLYIEGSTHAVHLKAGVGLNDWEVYNETGAGDSQLSGVSTNLDVVDGIVDAILDDTGTAGVVVAAGSKTGYALSATGADLIADTSTFALAVADAIWDEVLTGGTHNVATSAGKRLRELGTTVIRTGTAQAGAANSITLDAAASATDQIYDETLITILAGTGAGQSRMIVEYNGTTKVAIVGRAWEVNPSSDSEFQMSGWSAPLLVDHGLAQAGAAGTITLASTASATNDIYVGSQVVISTSTGAGQVRTITAYNGTTKVATVTPNWVVNPTSSSVYKIIPNSLGEILADTNELQTDWANGGRLDLLLDTAASGSSSLSAQDVRDAMKLAPSAGAAVTGSIDDLLADLGTPINVTTTTTIIESE